MQKEISTDFAWLSALWGPKMSDVVLFFPKTGYDIKNASVELPLSMLSLASVLVDDYDVKIIDQRIDDDWEKELEHELFNGTLAVAMSAMIGTQIRNALSISNMAKESGCKCSRCERSEKNCC